MVTWSRSSSTSSRSLRHSESSTAKPAASSLLTTSPTRPRASSRFFVCAGPSIWEDVWASEFVTAVRGSGGVLLEGGRIPYELRRSRVRGPPRGNLTEHNQGDQHHAPSPTHCPHHGSNRSRRRYRDPSSPAPSRHHQEQKYAAQQAAAQPAPQPEVVYAGPRLPSCTDGWYAARGDRISSRSSLQLKDQGILTEEEFVATEGQDPRL